MFSEKQTSAIPDEVFDAAVGQGVTAVDFSKNLLTSVPSRYTVVVSANTAPCLLLRLFFHFVCRLLEFGSSLSDVNLGFNRLSGCDPICSLLQLTHVDLRYSHTCIHTLLSSQTAKVTSVNSHLIVITAVIQLLQ